MKWEYGVTTVPSRRDELLPRTLASLKRGGFNTPTLFVDGEKDPESWRDEFKLEVVTRWPVIRTFGNWTLAIAELYIRNPTADRYAIFQDDFVTCLGLREYLSACEYPRKGYLNLYTFASNTLGNLRKHGLTDKPLDYQGWYPSNQNGRGAVALVFDNEAVITLLTHEFFVNRPKDMNRGWRAIDGGIVTALGKAGWKEYVHTPSLVQHTGTYSSMRSKPHQPSPVFIGESADARDLLKKDQPVLT